MSANDSLDLRWFFGVARRRRWLIIACTALGLVAALVVTTFVPALYTASVSILVSPDSQLSMLDHQAAMVSERLALTSSQMPRDRVTAQAVVAQLGLDESPEAHVKRVKAEHIPNTQKIRLILADSSPEQAALLADAFADAFSARVKDMQQERFGGIETAHPSRGVAYARS